ncbi:RNA-dependent RNA polymerase [Phytophthora cinnamomi ormycovirus 1-1]|uniref:RNA-dependent RNA polymerase n=1 Tax=Phytophthora cinnamomi ormycovirus 1-1 TaxID=3239319 RepID=A0AB39J9G9_9VIRU
MSPYKETSVCTTDLELTSKVANLSADTQNICRHSYGPEYVNTSDPNLAARYSDIAELSSVLERISPDRFVLNEDSPRPEIYSKSSYIRQPISFPNNCVIPDYVRRIFLSDSAENIWSAGLEARDEYDRTGNSYLLELSHVCLCVALYGKECIGLRDPNIKLGSYIYNTVNFGPSFATFLKKLRNVHTTWCFKAHGNAVTREYLEYRSEIIEAAKIYFPALDLEKSRRSYDNFLNESYLILYDDDTTDFEYSFIEEEFDEDYIEAFEDALRRIIPMKDIADPTLEEEAFWVSDSKTFDSEGLSKKINRSIIRENPKSRGQLTHDLKFCRTKIVVGPANIRDSWIGDLDSLYTVKRISHDLRQLVADIEYSAMAQPMVVSKRMERFRDLSTHYIMLDFKKAGLTFPHVLLKSIKKILKEIYPTVESFDYIDAFVGCDVYDYGTWRKPLRGTGLGNGNEIVTLAQCAVADIMHRKLDWDAIIYNDDGVWKTDSGNQRRNMGSIVGFFKNLGFIINYKKTFFSRRNIFCEEYWSPEEFWLKKQRFFLNISNIFLSRTIFEAKKSYHQCKASLIGTIYDFDLDSQVKRFWGYEAHPFEYELPTSLGGWNFVEDSNLNSCFRWFERRNRFVAPHIRSHIDTAKRFMSYLILKGGLDKFFSTRIEYGRKITEGMLDCMPRNILSDFERSANAFYGISNNDDIISQEIQLLNSRSYKSSRPAIVVGAPKKNQLSLEER